MAINWYRIPVLNVFYDLLFDDPPSLEQVNSIMSVFALMNGLFITVTAAVMNIFGPEDAKAARDKIEGWKTTGWAEKLKIGVSSAPTHDPLDDFKQMSTLGFATLAAAIMMLVVLYLGTTSIHFKGPAGEHDASVFMGWWSVTRWLFLFMMLLTVIGLWATVCAVQDAFICQTSFTPQEMIDTVQRMVIYDTVFCGVIGVGIPLILVSGALINRERAAGRLTMKEAGGTV